MLREKQFKAIAILVLPLTGKPSFQSTTLIIEPGETTRRDIAQGRLYSLLWKGDLSLLQSITPEPSAPPAVGKLCEPLQGAKPFLFEKIATGMKGPNVFAMGYDRCNPISFAKFNTIMGKLASGITSQLFREKCAAAQVFLYALMISKRTGMPLDRFHCGYFDASGEVAPKEVNA